MLEVAREKKRQDQFSCFLDLDVLDSFDDNGWLGWLG